MGNAVVADGLDGRIAVNNLFTAHGGRVAKIHGTHVALKAMAQLGKLSNEQHGQVAGTMANLLGIIFLATERQNQACLNLIVKQIEELLALHANVIFNVVGIHPLNAEESREKHTAAKLDDASDDSL